MKKLLGLPLVILAVAGLILGGPAVAAEKPITLKLCFEWSETGNVYQYGYKPWIAEVEKRTNGRVKIVPYFSNSLAPLPEFMQTALTGVADLVETDAPLAPGQLPLQEMFSQLLPSSPWTRWSKVYWDLMLEFDEWNKKELKGLKPIFTQSFGAGKIAMLKKPIRSVEDIPGTKLMAIGAPSINQLTAMGFTVIEKYPPEFFSTLDKGVTDGCGLCEQALYYEFGIAPLLKYVIDVCQGNVNFTLVMNPKTWDSLPPDIQKVFEDVGGYYAADLFDNMYYQKLIVEGRKMMWDKYGCEFIRLPAEDMATLDERVKPYQQSFRDKMAAKGLPAQEIYDRYHQLIKENKF